MDKYIALKIYTKTGIEKKNVFLDKKVLHLGCGNNKLSGALGVDLLPLKEVDVVHNLDNIPWPFEPGSIDVFFAHSILEHIDNLVDFFNEIWRLAKPSARVILAVPYFRSIDSFTDPTHKHFFTSYSLDYFTNKSGSLSKYCYIKHKLKQINFWYGWPHKSNNILINQFKNFIYKHPKFYDQYLSLLFPMKILIWELEVEK